MLATSLFATSELEKEIRLRLPKGAGDTYHTFLRQSVGVYTRTFNATGLSPGATGADNVIAAFTLPANFFNFNKTGGMQCLEVEVLGVYGSNGNNKEVKIIFNPATAVVGNTVSGGTTVVDTGTVTSNGTAISVKGRITKYGNDNANTQLTSAHTGGTTAPTAATATENAAILLAITGNAGTTASDIVIYSIELRAFN